MDFLFSFSSLLPGVGNSSADDGTWEELRQKKGLGFQKNEMNDIFFGMNDLKGAVKGKDAEVALSADGFVC
jgi:hypothetical protein